MVIFELMSAWYYVARTNLNISVILAAEYSHSLQIVPTITWKNVKFQSQMWDFLKDIDAQQGIQPLNSWPPSGLGELFPPAGTLAGFYLTGLSSSDKVFRTSQS